MALRLPEYTRIVLKNGPLKEVICQAKFPPILAIGAGPPAQFQDAIRDFYPNFVTEQQMVMGVPGEGGPIERIVAAPAIWRFRDREEAWTISLTTEFLALSTSRYMDFAEFLKRFRDVFQAAKNIYRLSFLTRIGLRYRNVLEADRDSGLQVWRESLQPMYTATLSTDAIANGWLSSQHDVRVEQPDGILAIKYGLLPSERDAERLSFLLDFDYYDEREPPVETLLERLQAYNETLYRLFRWSIGPPLLESFEPQPA